MSRRLIGSALVTALAFLAGHSSQAPGHSAHRKRQA